MKINTVDTYMKLVKSYKHDTILDRTPMQIHRKFAMFARTPSSHKNKCSVTFAGDPVSLPALLVATDEGVLWAFPQVARLARVRDCVQV